MTSVNQGSPCSERADATMAASGTATESPSPAVAMLEAGGATREAWLCTNRSPTYSYCVNGRKRRRYSER